MPVRPSVSKPMHASPGRLATLFHLWCDRRFIIPACDYPANKGLRHDLPHTSGPTTRKIATLHCTPSTLATAGSINTLIHKTPSPRHNYHGCQHASDPEGV
ncbi:hypothetical protein AB1N83_005940 [Pleurotus pulmonarius]